MRFPLLAVMSCLLAAPIQGAEKELEENEATLVGAVVQTDDLWLSGMNLCVRKNEPATAMGMVRFSNQPRSLTYVFVIKGDTERDYVPAWKSEPTISGVSAREVGSIEIGGKRIEFAYSVQVDPKGKALPRELLVINNVRTDPKGGRVFLIDCTGKQVVWQQLDLRLPVPPPVPANFAGVEALSLKVMKDLKAESPAVKQFLRKD